MTPLRRIAIALWIAAFLLGGFLAANRWLRPADSPQAVATPTALELKVLPEITLKDLAGKRRSIGEWSGRTLLINFWATWCAPCRHEMPLLQQLQEASDSQQLQVIGIAIDRVEPVLRFVGETGVTYPVLVGEMDATRAAEQFGDAFKGLPFSAIAAPDGTILAIHTGEFNWAELTKIGELARLIATNGITVEAARAALSFPGSMDSGPGITEPR